MANTTSWHYPNLFDVSRNGMSIAADGPSIVNRVKLLLLTDPTELYMNPTYGVGLRKYLFQYNNANTLSLIKDKIIEQLRLWEPCVVAEDTIIEPGNLFTGDPANNGQDFNTLKFTVIMTSKFGEKLTVNLNNESIQ